MNKTISNKICEFLDRAVDDPEFTERKLREIMEEIAEASYQEGQKELIDDLVLPEYVAEKFGVSAARIEAILNNYAGPGVLSFYNRSKKRRVIRLIRKSIIEDLRPAPTAGRKRAIEPNYYDTSVGERVVINKNGKGPERKLTLIRPDGTEELIKSITANFEPVRDGKVIHRIKRKPGRPKKIQPE